MQTNSTHVTADIWLNEWVEDKKIIEAIESALNNQTGLTVLNTVSEYFPGGGVTGLWLLAESHASVHTFPERNYIAFDCFTCGEGKPMAALNEFLSILNIRKTDVKIIERGV